MDEGAVPPAGFREVQAFRQTWILALGLVVGLGLLGVLGWSVVQQLVLGEPFGNNPMPDDYLITMAAVMGPLIVLGIIFLLTGRLVTEVRLDGVHLELFLPMVRRYIAFSEIESAEAVTYRPIRDFGGWGLRYNPRKGKAYNVSGNRGVRLRLTSGRELLIGSRRPEELAAAIAARLPRNPS